MVVRSIEGNFQLVAHVAQLLFREVLDDSVEGVQETLGHLEEGRGRNLDGAVGGKSHTGVVEGKTEVVGNSTPA